MLCQRCEKCLAVFANDPTFTEFEDDEEDNFCTETTDETTYSSIMKASDDCCYICVAILREFFDPLSLVSENTKLRLTYELHFDEEGFKTQDWAPNSSYLLIETHKESDSALVSRVNLQVRPLGHEKEVLPEDVKGWSTGSAETMDYIRRCKNECDRTHTRCTQSIGKPTCYPSRLIEVRTGQSVESWPRLVETSQGYEDDYASLSHSWGVSRNLKLSLENIDEFKNGIDPSQLPETFRHAIEVTRVLAIQWLWIDSLCIIQNSADDWAREVKTMEDVYANASVNISATHATNSSSGLYWFRDPAALEQCLATVSNGSINVPVILIGAAASFPRAVEGAPLNSRAWVMQERHLSRRMIHFAAGQVFWDCHNTISCESYSKGLPHTPVQAKSKSGLHLDLDLDSSFEAWRQIATTFMASRLSFEKDRVMAIEGLASFMSHKLNDRYYAGLWGNFIEWQLLWHVHYHGHRMHSSTFQRAPSWSWLSADRTVKLHEKFCGPERLLAVVEAVVVEKILDPEHGLYIRGSLSIWCHFYELRIQKSERNGFTGVVSQWPAEDLIITWDRDYKFADGDIVYLIPILEMLLDDPADSDPEDEYQTIQGILVREWPLNESTFARCGYIWINGTLDLKHPDYVTLASSLGKKPCGKESAGSNASQLITII